MEDNSELMLNIAGKGRRQAEPRMVADAWVRVPSWSECEKSLIGAASVRVRVYIFWLSSLK